MTIHPLRDLNGHWYMDYHLIDPWYIFKEINDWFWETHCNIFFLLHSNIASTSYLDGAVDCFHFLGFQPRKKIGVLICNNFFWITFQGVRVFGNILYLSNMVLEILWSSFIGDWNIELVFPSAWKDLWFFIFLWILWNMCSIASREMISVRNMFLFCWKRFLFS